MTTPSRPTLPHLLENIAAGDGAAFGEFYDQTSSRVYGMVLRVLRDPGYSEEVTQEVYVQVWTSAKSYAPSSGSPVAWLLTMAHRRAVDRVRREDAATRRDLNFAARAADREYDEVSETVTTREMTAAVRDCLDSLTGTQRESVDLAYYGGLTYREVADRLSVALPTVKSRIRDGLLRLRNCLGVGDA
ncbi:ECF RNA polymerase sigma factor SigK [Gordonia sp. X0973]|uniref:ECF RNA polymerase sigma factor SigK n=1 Tax=Gordonia sp. X0973 TaxID=2742602 RepID=UPI0034641240